MTTADAGPLLTAAQAADMAGYLSTHAWHNAVRRGTAPAPVPGTAPRRWAAHTVREFAVQRSPVLAPLDRYPDDAQLTRDQVRHVIGERDHGGMARKIRSGTLPPPGDDGTWHCGTLRAWLDEHTPVTATGQHYLPTRHAATVLRISPRHLLRLAQEGEVDAPLRVGRAYWWHPDAVARAVPMLEEGTALVGASRAARMMGLTRQGWAYRVAHDPQAPRPVRTGPQRWLASDVDAYLAAMGHATS